MPVHQLRYTACPWFPNRFVRCFLSNRPNPRPFRSNSLTSFWTSQERPLWECTMLSCCRTHSQSVPLRIGCTQRRTSSPTSSSKTPRTSRPSCPTCSRAEAALSGPRRLTLPTLTWRPCLATHSVIRPPDYRLRHLSYLPFEKEALFLVLAVHYLTIVPNV